MPPRYKTKRRCRNCPETEEGLPVQSSLPVSATTYIGEGDELWKAVSVACGTLFELMFRYVALNVPGKPLSQLERLHNRLGEIIEIRKKREHENVRASEDGGTSPTADSKY